MRTFDELLGAVRDDCDTTHLAGSAELRRAGRRRTNLHRTIGGAAALVVVGGLTTGAAMYGHGGSPVAQGSSTGSTPAAATTWSSKGVCLIHGNPATVTCTTPPSSPQPIVCVSGAGCGVVTVQPQPTGPVSHPPSTATTPAGTSPGACSVANFDVAHAQVNEDDASGIKGFDIVIAYRGAKSCKLGQGTTVTYLDASGHRVGIPLSQTAAPFTVKPHTSISTSVFGPTDAAVNPTPPECAQPHVYAHLDVRIDGHSGSLGATTISLPCGGAKALPWSAA